jgi:hypothetical protein
VQAQLTKTPQSGTFFLSGELQVTNTAKYPVSVTSVRLVSTTGQFGEFGGSAANS